MHDITYPYLRGTRITCMHCCLARASVYKTLGKGMLHLLISFSLRYFHASNRIKPTNFPCRLYPHSKAMSIHEASFTSLLSVHTHAALSYSKSRM